MLIEALDVIGRTAAYHRGDDAPTSPRVNCAGDDYTRVLIAQIQGVR